MQIQNREEVLQQLLQKKRPHFDPHLPIILFWSPKSGCTTLMKWFLYQTNQLDNALKYSWWVHDYYNKTYTGNLNHNQKLYWNLINNKRDTYKLVRNPYTRVVSAYLMLINEHEPYWNQVWRKIRKELYHDINSKKGLTFTEFLLYIQQKGADSPELDIHFSQQYQQREEEFVKNLIYLENFQNEIAEIEKNYHLRSTNSKKLSDSPHNLRSRMTFTGDYTNVNILDPSFPRFPKFEAFFNSQTKQLVEEIYQIDFEKYRYDKVLP